MKKIVVSFLSAVLIFTMGVNVFSSERMLMREEIPVMEESDLIAEGFVSLGVLRGTGEGLELARPITRAEAVALLMRLHPDVTGAMGLPSPEFSDLDGHWAYKEVTYAKKLGLVEGVGDGRFEPDRVVTGKEFTKMLLSMMGYDDVTIDNAYELGVKVQILDNNFTKSVVVENLTLLRGDTLRILWASLIGKTNDGVMFYKKLIEKGKYQEEDFSILYSID